MTDTAPWPSTPLDTCQDELTSASHADLASAIDQLLSRLTLMDTSQRLHHLRQLQHLVNAQVEKAAKEARSSGSTWQEIGQSLGITRQAAQSRWGGHNNQGEATSNASERAPNKKPNEAPKKLERLTVSLPGIRGSLKLVVARQRIAPQSE
jgi:hypothetical protein